MYGMVYLLEMLGRCLLGPSAGMKEMGLICSVDLRISGSQKAVCVHELGGLQVYFCTFLLQHKDHDLSVLDLLLRFSASF